MGTSSVSPDGTMLAYSTDFKGDERFTLRFKNLETGEALPDEITDIFYGGAWSADGSTFFYTRVDDAWRPYQVYRHTLGTREDVLVYQEDDERYWVGIGLTRSERYLVLGAGSKITSEVRILDATDPTGEFVVVRPRKTGVEYGVEHAGDFFYILHNENAENFELATAPLDAPDTWTPLIPHRDDTRLLEIDAFSDHAVVHFRRDGLTGLRVLPYGAAGATGASGSRRRSATRTRSTSPSPCTTPAPRATRSSRPRGCGWRTRAWSPRPACTTTSSTPTTSSCSSGARCWAATTRPTTSSSASGPPPTTAPRSPCRSSSERAPPGPPRRSCTGTAATRPPSTRASRCRGCRCSTGASSSRSPTCGAAARWAATGTRTAS
ncbi:hypothetical protein ACFQYP_57755 [Nonomuraea antimicrobica]